MGSYDLRLFQSVIQRVIQSSKIWNRMTKQNILWKLVELYNSVKILDHMTTTFVTSQQEKLYNPVKYGFI